MSDTLFVKNTTVIPATWLNDVNTNTYSAANKAALVLLTPALGLKVFVSSSDGGLFKAVVGAAALTYSDNGGAYCGTITIPTGGDGSIAWVRVDLKNVESKAFGAVHDDVTDDTVALKAWAAHGGSLALSTGTALADTAQLDFSVNNTSVIGIVPCRIKSSGLDTEDLITVSGDDITFTGIEAEGIGTFVDDGITIAAIFKVTGDRCIHQLCKLIDPPSAGVYYDRSLDSSFSGSNSVEGGPAAIVGTAHFGIYGIDCYKLKVMGNTFRKKVGGGNQTTGVFISSTAGGTDIDGDTDVAMHDVMITSNFFLNCNDHGVYVNAGLRSIVDGNTCKYVGNTALAVGNSYNANTTRTGNSVSNNIIYKAGENGGTSTPAIHLRDSSNATCIGNIIDDCPTGILVGTVQSNSPINNNVISGNTIYNYVRDGIKFAKEGGVVGKEAIDASNNTISGNIIDTGTKTAGEMHVAGNAILFSIAQTAAANISFKNKIFDNKIIGAPDVGIYATNQDYTEIYDNTIINTGLATSAANKYGIFLNNLDLAKLTDNKIFDDQSVPTMVSGIYGSSTVTNSDIKNNTVLGSTGVALAVLQQASHGNTFGGNRINTDALTGEVTLGAAATTVVTNNNARNGGGYKNYTRLTPLNAAAATLVGSTKSPYRSTEVADTSFTIATADAVAAAGTETFLYEIIG